MSEVETLATTPPPATTPWVPLWNLVGGVNLVYDGLWQTGHSYKDGEIVVDNGVTYLCVRDTTKRPTPWPPVPSAATYATTLPPSPLDGQEAVLVDNVTNPSYQWRFRYNAGSSSAYKWEFVGGAPASVYVAANENSATVNAWKNLPTDGPLLVLPRAGDYLVAASAGGQSGTAATTMYIGIAPGNTTPTVSSSAYFATAARDAPLAIAAVLYAAQAAGVAMKLRYYTAQASDNWHDRILNVTPVRVA
jgi:hypothetical protein